jgi:glutathione S-transferase
MTRGNIVSWMLEELGIPYDLDAMSLERGDHRRPGYLAINPMGKVPAITHKGIVVTEAAAICAYLADEFPAANLSVPIGDPRRGLYLKWLFFGPVCLEQAIIDRTLDRPVAQARTLSYGDFDRTMDTVAKALASGPYLLGQQFTTPNCIPVRRLGNCVVRTGSCRVRSSWRPRREHRRRRSCIAPCPRPASQGRPWWLDCADCGRVPPARAP